MVMFRRQSSTGSVRSNSDYTVGYGIESKYGEDIPTYKDKDENLYDPELSYESRKEDHIDDLKPLKMSRSSSLSSESKKDPMAFTRSPAFWKVFTIVQYVAFAITFYFAVSTNKTLSNQLAILAEVTDMTDSLQDKLFDKEEELYETHNDFTRLNLKLNAISPSIEKQEVYSAETRRMISDTFIQRHDAQADRVIALKDAIRDFDRRDLERRYGQGPYNIEVAVVVEGIRKYFTIQTAPNDIAPHAVRVFMDMIERKVWQETVLYHQADHVVIAVPINMEGVRKSDEDAKPILFSEYSSDYPHKKYTVGFQGHPGGPEFYINMDDNDSIHGPGGQEYHDVTDDGDTCFGEITHGRDVLEHFAEINKKALNSKTGVFYSLIESMTIVRIYNTAGRTSS